MHQYRQVIHRMRMGQSDRAIAKADLMGRVKCAQVRIIALKNGWLGTQPLPDDAQLVKAFVCETGPNPTHQSLSLPYEQQIGQWVKDGIQTTTIYQALVSHYGFTGSYS